jgi:hypothetical protein
MKSKQAEIVNDDIANEVEIANVNGITIMNVKPPSTDTRVDIIMIEIEQIKRSILNEITDAIAQTDRLTDDSFTIRITEEIELAQLTLESEIKRLRSLDQNISRLKSGIETMNEQHGIANESPTVILKATESPTIILKATESPTVILKANESPTVLLKANESPTVLLKANESPTVILKANESPTVILKANESPTVLLKANESPTVILKANESPTVICKANESPTILLKANESPTVLLKANESPTVLLKANESPTVILNANERPTSLLNANENSVNACSIVRPDVSSTNNVSKNGCARIQRPMEALILQTDFQTPPMR